jgi:hypothetical protein
MDVTLIVNCLSVTTLYLLISTPFLELWHSGYWIVPDPYCWCFLQGKVNITAPSGVKLEIPDGAVLDNKVWLIDSPHAPISSIRNPQPQQSVMLCGVTTDALASLLQDVNDPKDLWEMLTVAASFFRGHVTGAAPLITPTELLSFVIVMCIPAVRVLWARYRIIVILFGASVLLFLARQGTNILLKWCYRSFTPGSALESVGNGHTPEVIRAVPMIYLCRFLCLLPLLVLEDVQGLSNTGL